MANPIKEFTSSGIYGAVSKGVVVDYNDPEERGRIRIRLQNQDNIPKDKLPWVFPQGTMGGQIGGSGVSSHRLQLGQFVEVVLDPATNQPLLITAGIASPSGEQNESGDKDKQPGWPTQAREKTSQDNMKAPKTRSSEQDGHIVEDEKDEHLMDPNSKGRPKFNLDTKQLREQALKILNGPAKFDEHPTAGPQKQMADAIKHIKQFDPSNRAGAIKPALDMLQNLLKKGGAGNGNPFQNMSSMVGGGPFQQFMQIVASLRGGGGDPNRNNQPEPQQPLLGQPCFIELEDGSTANGHYMIIGGRLTCRQD